MISQYNGLIYLLIFILLVAILAMIIYVYHNPSIALMPYNLAISAVTPKKVFYTDIEKEEIFPQSSLFEARASTIRKEASKIMKISRDNVSRYYTNENDSFYEGWNTFPLRLFGVDIEENMKLCPLTSEILKQCDNVPTAFFSILEPGKTLDPHTGPFKGILRYHLGLIIPPKDSGKCYLTVDDIKYTWSKGEGVLFDETYLHSATNQTPYPRVVLFLDVKRPFRTSVMTKINDMILYGIKISPHNQTAIMRSTSSLR